MKNLIARSRFGAFALTFLLFFPVITFAQQWEWAKPIGGYPNFSTFSFPNHNIAPAHGDGVILAEDFLFEVDLNGTKLTHFGQALYLAKYNVDGSIDWAKKVAESDSTHEVETQGVATDANGNIFITGYFEDTIHFGATELIAKNGLNAFIAKFSATGILAWAKKMGSGNNTNADNAWEVGVDSQNNVYISGWMAGSMTFAGTTVGTKNNTTDLFVAKFDTNGNEIWARTIGSDKHETSYSLTVDASDNIFIVGTLCGNTTIGTTNYTVKGNADFFVVKFNNSGSLVWAKNIGGSATEIASDVTTDLQGNVYVSGIFKGSFTVGSTTVSTTNHASDEDIFVLKFSATGQTDWLKSLGSPTTFDSWGGVTFSKGNLYVTGNIGEELFLNAYNAGGALQHTQLVGSTGWNSGIDVTADLAGNIYLYAIHEGGTINVGPHVVTGSGMSSPECFIARWSPALVSGWNEALAVAQIKAFPNPFKSEVYFSIDNSMLSGRKLSFALYSAEGKKVKEVAEIKTAEFVLRRDNLPAGLYQYRFTNESGGMQTGKLVIAD